MKMLVRAGFCVLVLASAGGAGGALVPTPIGAGARFHPTALSVAAANGEPIGALPCRRSGRRRVGVHLELFARGRVVVVPAGVGIARPVRRRGPYVLSGRCSYPLRTREPTGVIEVVAGKDALLGDFFAVWGQTLGRHRLAGFQGAAGEVVRAYVDGRRVQGAPASIRLVRHREIVLELGAYVPPHTSYRFRSGL